MRNNWEYKLWGDKYSVLDKHLSSSFDAENPLFRAEALRFDFKHLAACEEKGAEEAACPGQHSSAHTVWDLLQWQGKKRQASAGSFGELLIGCLRMLPIYSFYYQAGSVRLFK